MREIVAVLENSCTFAPEKSETGTALTSDIPFFSGCEALSLFCTRNKNQDG